MLDQYLSMLAKKDEDPELSVKVAHVLKDRSVDELFAIASGQVKVAELFELEKVADDDEWLDKFKGTPLFDQAMQLMKQDLSNDMALQNNRQQRRAEREDNSDQAIYDAQDSVRMQKKMLDLQLAELQETAAGSPPMQVGGQLPEQAPPPQGAGAPGDADLSSKEAALKLRWADQMGRKLAHAEHQKIAQARDIQQAGAALAKMADMPLGLSTLPALGAMAGALKGSSNDRSPADAAVMGGLGAGLGGFGGRLVGQGLGSAAASLGGLPPNLIQRTAELGGDISAPVGALIGYKSLTKKYNKKPQGSEKKKEGSEKIALDTKMLANLGTKALSLAKQNPQLAASAGGALAGAAGGAIGAGKGHRLSGALGGAAAGGALGHAAGGIGSRMGKGLDFSTAAQQYGKNVASTVKGIPDKVRAAYSKMQGAQPAPAQLG